MKVWQFIAGGGEDEDETIIISAKREAYDGCGILQHRTQHPGAGIRPAGPGAGPRERAPSEQCAPTPGAGGCRGTSAGI